jgi:uncharacterized membrane protein YcaP (DUF421 family)
MDWPGLNRGFHDLIGSDKGAILWWQMSVRALLVFLFGLVLIRLFGRRAFGKQTALDIVLAIVVGSNLSRALTANAPFFPTLAATAAIVLLFWLLSSLSARWQSFSRLVKGNPIWLIRDGRPDKKKMRRAAVSEGDIDEAARQSGLAGIRGVDEAVLERSGKISTIERG